MMGAALRTDSNNLPGVFIDPQATRETSGTMLLDRNGNCSQFDLLSSAAKRQRSALQSTEMAAAFHSSPYVARVMHYVQSRCLPFEHVDIWVPSFITNPMDISAPRQDDTCRLCFAGTATADIKMPPGGIRAVPMTSKEKFNMISFGVYSQRFSFVVGSGLPGRIYSSGVASWEQGIQSAPQSLFERVGGAQQWNVETVLGIPVASPNVGRVVVLFYSMHDRKRDADLVNRIAEELTALIPSPRWKLVVEVGEAAPLPGNIGGGSSDDPRIADLLSLIKANMPEDQHAPLAPLLPGITSLRLLLLKPSRTPEEQESLDVALNSYEAYKIEGRSAAETVGLTSRALMVMSRQDVPPPPSLPAGPDSSATNAANTLSLLMQQQYQNLSANSGGASLNPGLTLSSLPSQLLNANVPLSNASQLTGIPNPMSSQEMTGNNQTSSATNLSAHQMPGNNQLSSTSTHMNTQHLTGNDQQAPVLNQQRTNTAFLSTPSSQVGATNFDPFQQGAAQGVANIAPSLGTESSNNATLSHQQLPAPQLPPGAWNDVLEEFGNLDPAVLNNLASSGVSAAHLAALLQSESTNFP